MLCTTCRRSLVARLPTFRNHVPALSRSVVTAPATSNAAPIIPPPRSSTNTPATSSSTLGTSQPLSAPHGSSISSSPATKARKSPQRSSVSGGTVLSGLGYTKAKPTILAKEDEEYPDWLWNILDEKGGSVSGGIDVASKLYLRRCRMIC